MGGYAQNSSYHLCHGAQWKGALVTITAQARGTMVAVLQLGPNAPSHISHRLEPLGSVAELITFW